MSASLGWAIKLHIQSIACGGLKDRQTELGLLRLDAWSEHADARGARMLDGDPTVCGQQAMPAPVPPQAAFLIGTPAEGMSSSDRKHDLARIDQEGHAAQRVDRQRSPFGMTQRQSNEVLEGDATISHQYKLA